MKNPSVTKSCRIKPFRPRSPGSMTKQNRGGNIFGVYVNAHHIIGPRVWGFERMKNRKVKQFHRSVQRTAKKKTGALIFCQEKRIGSYGGHEEWKFSLICTPHWNGKWQKVYFSVMQVRLVVLKSLICTLERFHKKMEWDLHSRAGAPMTKQRPGRTYTQVIIRGKKSEENRRHATLR